MAMAEARKLAAIMFTDMAGFSRQVGADEARALHLLDTHNAVIRRAVAAFHGQVLRFIGDAFLVEFPSVVNAVQCAQQIHAQFRDYNAGKAKDEQIHVRIGIHLGDIIRRDSDVFGDGANIAARLQELAAPDTICISQKVYEEVDKKVSLGTVVPLGKPKLKNIAQRFAVYVLLSEAPKGVRQTWRIQRLKLARRVGSAPRVVALMALLVLVGAGAIALRDRYFSSPSGLPLPDKPSIVVLPFVNLSGDPGQEYFSDGLTEELTSSLSRLSGLFVISRNSAFTYKGRAVKVQEISKELGVRYVLEGSVRKADHHIRITAQLIDATTDYHLWSERYDRSLTDIFMLQDEIVQKIVTTLDLQLTAWEKGYLVRKRTNNLEAYDLLLRGTEAFFRALYETKKEANGQARQLFEQAIALDPQYAEAYAYLGWSYWEDWLLGWQREPQTMERALALAQKALALDDTQAAARRLLASIYLWQKQHERAIAEGERALVLDPNWTNAYMELGIMRAFAGQPEEAIGLIEQAMRRNPREPYLYLSALGFAYRIAGQCEQAIIPLKRALTFNPNFLPARYNLAICYAELNRLEEAQAEAKEVRRINPHFSVESQQQVLPFKDPAALERTLAGLRKAGLK